MIWVVVQIRVPFTILFIRVPYCFGDLKRDLNLENYPYLDPSGSEGSAVVLQRVPKTHESDTAFSHCGANIEDLCTVMVHCLS